MNSISKKLDESIELMRTTFDEKNTTVSKRIQRITTRNR